MKQLVIFSFIPLAVLVGCDKGDVPRAEEALSPSKAVTTEPATQATPEATPAAGAEPTEPSDLPRVDLSACTSFDACTLTCPEGAKLVKYPKSMIVACHRGEVSDDTKVQDLLDGIHGPVVAWHPGGQMMLHGVKMDGKAHGHWKNWHFAGQQAAETTYDMDKQLSQSCWDDQGKVLDPDKDCADDPFNADWCLMWWPCSQTGYGAPGTPLEDD